MNICGGYFITRAVDREAHRSVELLPSRLLSLSDCICSFVPDLWAIDWVRFDDDAREADAARAGVSSEMLPAIVEAVTNGFTNGLVGWPSVFYDIAEARRFAARFLERGDGFTLLGAALHGEQVDAFVRAGAPAEGFGEPGVYTRIRRGAPLEPGGTELGWEVLCYDSGGTFHSWLCNGLEVGASERFGVRPNARGFIDAAADAKRVAAWCGSGEVGAEPGFWSAWQMVEYALSDESAGLADA